MALLGSQNPANVMEGKFEVHRALLGLVELKCASGYRIVEIATGGVSWSRGLYELLGIDSAGVAPDQRHFERLVHPSDIAAYRKSLPQRVVVGGAGLETEFRVIRPNGTTRWLACRSECLFNPAGEATQAVSVFFDITPRMEARARVEYLEQMQLKLARFASAVAWPMQLDGMRQESQAWQELTGQTPFDASGQGWLNAIHPGDREVVRDAWSRVEAAPNRLLVSFRLRTREGIYRRFAMRLAPVANDAGERAGWIGACLDIEELSLESISAAAIHHGAEGLLTSAHLRAARGALNWSVRDLATAAGVTAAVVRKYEEGIPARSQGTQLLAIRTALVGAGVSFLKQADGSTAVGVLPPANFARMNTKP